MTLGQNIRSLRRERGLTLRELGELCGIDADTLAQYERGEVNPRAAAVERIAAALGAPIVAIREGMGWTAPESVESWERSGGDELLYGGILENLRESYGGLDGAGEAYLVGGSEGFVLGESDIQALMESVKASIPALVEHMKDSRAESEINREILARLADDAEDVPEEESGPRWELSDEQWEQVRPLLPPERAGRGRAFKSNRLMLDGIIFHLRSGNSWPQLPERYGRWKCVADRLRLWRGSGVWNAVEAKLREIGALDGK